MWVLTLLGVAKALLEEAVYVFEESEDMVYPLLTWFRLVEKSRRFKRNKSRTRHGGFCHGR